MDTSPFAITSLLLESVSNPKQPENQGLKVRFVPNTKEGLSRYGKPRPCHLRPPLQTSSSNDTGETCAKEQGFLLTAGTNHLTELYLTY